MQTALISTHEPVLKIGAVVLRADCKAVLIMQPIPKTPGDIPAYVLPRGSRQYQAEDGSWHDARDAATGHIHAATLEPFRRGLEREIEEEAGITPTQLTAAKVSELGALAFQSRAKGIYPIHWFVVVIDAELADALLRQTPVDALSILLGDINGDQNVSSRRQFFDGVYTGDRAGVTPTRLTRSHLCVSARGR